jgi:two-component system sensor histidine kinase VanS
MKGNPQKKRGIFIKVFTYTLLFLFLMIAVTAVFFAQQFASFYESGQIRQLSRMFQPVMDQIEGKSPGEIAAIAKDFHEKNQSFSFVIEDRDRNVLYSTTSALSGSQAAPLKAEDPARSFRIILQMSRGQDHYILRGANSIPVLKNYEGLIKKTLLALAVMLTLCTLGAVFFAREITRPIKKLAGDTKRMARLEQVPEPAGRNDEIGQLAQDIYNMYGALQRTIADLEQEIIRERTMEENQRAFFSAASHELKTPIAAANALVEGMLANIGDYRDHRKYLRECLRMLNAQNRLVSEILELVKPSEGRRELVLETLDLGEVLPVLINEYEPIAEQRGQRILNRTGTLRIRADRKLLGRAISNVLSNALQNTPDGEPVQIWDEPNPKEPGAIRLNIFNPGAFIEEDALGRLFEPFYRRDPARSRDAGRSGLGLSIVKRNLDEMGFPFALQNTKGGVLFWMDLPLAAD